MVVRRCGAEMESGNVVAILWWVVMFSRPRESSIEKVFKKNNALPLHEFVIESEDWIGWFFHTFDKTQSRNNVYYDDVNLQLIDGIAVIGDAKEGYRLSEPEKDFSEDSHTAFSQSLNKNVSNVNIISVRRNRTGLTVNFASQRAAGGRVWYILNNNGLILCDDYRLLLPFTSFEIDPRAIYAILKYGNTPDPITIIKNIYSVLPSHFAMCSTPDFNMKVKPYFQFDFSGENNCNLKPTKEILQKSGQFLSSIDALLLLSGGIDSTLFAHQLDSGTTTDAFYLAFGSDDPELKFAKEAAKEARVNLTTFYMDGVDVVQAIKGVASSYMHPFSDYSTIPTYYLINHIKNIHPDGGILFDGNGAEYCFGWEGLTHSYSYLWKLVYAQPRFIKHLGRVLYDKGEIYKRASKRRSLLPGLAKSCESDIQLVPLVLSPIESFFTKETRSCAQEVGSAFLKVLTSCMAESPRNNKFYPKATVGGMLHSCRGMCLKTFRIGKEPLIDVVYPYLWKDILVEQGRLSWNCKVKDGIIKWPLKKLLEGYMPQEFIYRKKSGFRPPFMHWLLQKDVHNFVSDTLLNPEAFIANNIKTEKVQKLLRGLPLYKSASPAALHFLWGALFTELWLEENYKSL